MATQAQMDGQRTHRNVNAFRPPVDVYESSDGLLLRMDVPGVAEQDLNIEINQRTLSVNAKRVTNTGEMAYARHFNVPEDLEVKDITARLTDGVLDLHLPRREETKPRKIRVTAG